MDSKSRQHQLREFYDRIAYLRERWILKNQTFYDDDRSYMRFLIPEGRRVLELGCGTGSLLNSLEPEYGVGIDLSSRMIEQAQKSFPNYKFVQGDIEQANTYSKIKGPFDAIILSDLLGNLSDVQSTLEQLKKICSPDTRIIISYYSPLWEPILRLAQVFGMRMPQPELTWLSSKDISSFLELAGLQVIKCEWRQLLPKRMLGIGPLINKYLSTLPGFRVFCLRHYVVARVEPNKKLKSLSSSIVIPCRNEKGNIEEAVKRLPAFCNDIEIIYVEGGSSDGTYEECQRVRDKYTKLDIKIFEQPGTGKGDAVRKGFDEARGDVLIILDADLTVKPEEIPKFYNAILTGKGEFINGTRFIYPMETGAMRFLNYWANRMFSVVFSWLLNQRFTDTLCGTKVLRKKHYRQVSENRSYFGEFDPFGDFDLIFGAAKQNLKIAEIPIRYAERSYGETQISRFRHGLLLLKMVAFAFYKFKALRIF